MDKRRVAAIVGTGIAAACGAFVAVLLLIKLLWAWTIPDLFPGAVERGFIAGAISWLTAAKVALLAAILSGLAGGHQARSKR